MATPPAPPSRSIMDLRELTPARVALGRCGAGLPTTALLDFTLDHARARDAVHAAFDAKALILALGGLSLAALGVCSRAGDRKDYLRRPDLGRRLDQASVQLLAESRGTGGAGPLAIVIGERPGLSAPDSLGAYLTFAPRVGRSDAERNCVSNIHGAGLGYDEAAFKIAWLVREGLAREVTGVALKDERGGRMPGVSR